jgi:DNA topoisomerase-1
LTTDSPTAAPDQARSNGSIKRLVIVESPAKARTIGQFLGPEYIVESSVGHIRDLPSSAAQIPKKYAKEKWARLGVDIEQNFEPLYVIPPDKTKTVTALKKALKEVDELYLATDEDREGEAIAWHLLEVLKPKIPVFRMVFHEITREAIQKALEQPREVDRQLVEAQETRRILDRLVGYEVSPVLWRKVKPRLSAGRVQSVAVRVVVERERQRMRFHSAGYWDVEAILATRDDRPEIVLTRMIELNGLGLATSRDFDPETGVLADASAVALLDVASATAVATALESATFTVTGVRERPYTQRAPAPFITSTLQQEAGRKLRYSAQRTMQVAQRLYENGYITYMRTDSPNLSEQATNAARRQATDLYGAEYIPDQPRRHTSKTKGAQEAHEAIRPAGEIFRTPDSIRRELDPDAIRLYELVWMRTVASQMKDATGVRTQVRLQAPIGDLKESGSGDRGTATFQTSGKVITFPGFLRAYVEGSDDPEAALDDQELILPPLAEGQSLDPTATEAKGHETHAPARWTEASLIRELEERGIGRPSTYASILQTIQDRGYVWKKGTSLIPTFIAFAVTRLLEEHFPDLVDYDFTARMEASLDDIADGKREGRPWLHEFYFGEGNGDSLGSDSMAQKGLHATISSGWEEIDARAVSSVALGEDDQKREVAVRVGRYGTYIQTGDEPVRAEIPEDTPPDEVDLKFALEMLHQATLGNQPLGANPQTGELIYLKTGRYGPYVQLGEDPARDDKGKISKDAPKPKRSSLWPDMTMETVTIEQALELLAYPRVVGVHPLNDTEITVQDGPNGPYLRCGDESRSLENIEQMRAIGLEEAVAVLAEPRRRRGAAPSQQVLAELGQHPDSGGKITVRSGRFGPYVTDGTVNASLPKNRDPKNIGLEDAINLIATREERLRAEGKDPRAPKKSGRTTTRSSGTRRKRSA